MKHLKSSLLVVFCLALLTVSCDDGENESPQSAPKMPPAQSMQMNFNNFQENNDGGRVESNSHWLRSVLHVGVWNTVLAVNLAVPVGAFASAVNQTPTYDNDTQMWTWTADHQIVGRTYSSRLTGKIVDNRAEWAMYISEENGFQNVLWFTGQSALDGKSGSWMLNKDGNNPTAYLSINWEVTGDEIGMIKYTSIEEGVDGEGSYITYSANSGSEFDRSFELLFTNGDNHITINWNSENGNGRISNEKFYGDEDFRCWNSNFEDTDC